MGNVGSMVPCGVIDQGRVIQAISADLKKASQGSISVSKGCSMDSIPNTLDRQETLLSRGEIQVHPQGSQHCFGGSYALKFAWRLGGKNLHVLRERRKRKLSARTAIQAECQNTRREEQNENLKGTRSQPGNSAASAEACRRTASKRCPSARLILEN